MRKKKRMRKQAAERWIVRENKGGDRAGGLGANSGILREPSEDPWTTAGRRKRESLKAQKLNLGLPTGPYRSNSETEGT